MKKVVDYYQEGFTDGKYKMEKISYLQELKMDLIFQYMVGIQESISRSKKIDKMEVLVNDIISNIPEKKQIEIIEWVRENIEGTKDNPYYKNLFEAFFFLRNFLIYRENLKKK